MTVATKVYSHFPTHLMNGLVTAMSSETAIKCMLCTSSFTPSQDNDDFVNDITNEVTGVGYTAGGVALTSTTISVASKTTTFDAADAQWTTATITARYAVIYDSTTGVTTTEPLICYIDFGADKSCEGGTFKLVFNADGIFSIPVA